MPEAQATQPNTIVIAPDLLRPNPWNRKRFDEKSLDELADSFRSAGQLQEITVRKHPKLKGKYEIVAGERRWRAASRVDGFTLRANVRELTDVQLVELLAIENLQREDVHELEEAVQYRFLMDSGYDVDTVAAKVGKSSSYVYQRIKLAELSKRASDLFLDARLTAGHAILLARLPSKTQDDVLDKCFYEAKTSGAHTSQPNLYLDSRNVKPEKRKDAEAIGVRGLDALIQTEILLNLDRAAFDGSDATLVPKAGSCPDCPKRTGAQPDLFPSDAKGNHCTDRRCYMKKTDANLDRRYEEIVALERFALLSENGPTDDKRFENVVSRWSWNECKIGSDGAVRSLIVTGARRGLLLWASYPGSGGNGNAMSADEKRWKEEQRIRNAKDKREALVNRRTASALWDAVVVPRKAETAKLGILQLDDLRRVAVRLWGEMWFENRKALAELRGWKCDKEKDEALDGVKRMDEMNAVQLAELLIELSFISVRYEHSHNAVDRDTLYHVAKQDGVDLKRIKREVEVALKAEEANRGKPKETPAEDLVELAPTEELAQLTGPELVTTVDAVAAVMKHVRSNKLRKRGKLGGVQVSGVLEMITGVKAGKVITLEDLDDHVRGNLTFAEAEETEDVD
jgi:ParB/RepB/Spo0J family partition protein